MSDTPHISICTIMIANANVNVDDTLTVGNGDNMSLSFKNNLLYGFHDKTSHYVEIMEILNNNNNLIILYYY